MSGPRVRFAPARASGLSLAAARTALFNWLFARSRGGTLLVRLDEAGDPRSLSWRERDLLDDLRWLGLGWDEGIDEGGAHGPYRRAERIEIHRRRAAQLAESRLAFPCFCSPFEAAGEGEEKTLPGSGCRCRRIPPTEAEERRRREPHVLRLNATALSVGGETLTVDDLVRGPIAIPAARIGDPLLVDRETRPAQEFSAAVDDHDMAISHVIREGDPLTGTPMQILLSRALKAERAPEFAHLPTITTPGGVPLTGADQDCAIGRFREQGYIPEALINYLVLLGWSASGGRDFLEREEILGDFDLGRVTREPVPFDRARLDALSAHHMARLPESRLCPLAIRHLQSAGLLPDPAPAGAVGWVGRLVMLFSERLVKMADLPDEAESIFEFDGASALLKPEVAKDLPASAARRVIASLVAHLDGRPLTAPRFQVIADQVRRETGLKGGDLYTPIRVALTGASGGPDLVKLLPIIEEGHRLPLSRPIPSCAERARAILAAIPGGGH